MQILWWTKGNFNYLSPFLKYVKGRKQLVYKTIIFKIDYLDLESLNVTTFIYWFPKPSNTLKKGLLILKKGGKLGPRVLRHPGEGRNSSLPRHASQLLISWLMRELNSRKKNAQTMLLALYWNWCHHTCVSGSDSDIWVKTLQEQKAVMALSHLNHQTAELRFFLWRAESRVLNGSEYYLNLYFLLFMNYHELHQNLWKFMAALQFMGIIF